MSFGKQLVSGLKQGFESAVKSLPGVAVGMGTSVLGGLINQGFERSSLDYQAQLNEQAALNAYNRDLDFWNKQNSYNSPASQISRLRAAGLNPALINANGVNNTAGQLSSGPQASPGSPGGNRVNPSADASALADYAYKIKQMGFLDTQTAEVMERILSIQVERGIKALEKELKLTESEKASLDYEEFYEALYGKSIDGGAPTISNNRYKTQIDEARSRIKLNEANEALASADKSLKNSMKEYQDTMARIANEQNDYQKKLLEEQANSAAASAAAQYANALVAQIQAQYVTSQKEQFDAKREIDLEIARAARDAGVAEAKIKEWEAERIKIKTNGPSLWNENGEAEWGQYIKQSMQFLMFNFPFVN